MKAVVLDFVEAEGTRTNLITSIKTRKKFSHICWILMKKKLKSSFEDDTYVNMLLCGVEYMGDSNALSKNIFLSADSL